MSIERILVNKLDANQSWDVIGLDLAKHDLSCVGIATNGEISRIDRISYESFLEWASTIEPTVFAMEPCCEANYLCNQLESFGHSCRVISGKAVQQYIDVYFSGQKNDINDAEAIAFLGKNSRLKNIRTKTPDEMRGISHKMGRRFLRRGTRTFSSSGTAIYGVSLIHNQLGLDALVDCFKN